MRPTRPASPTRNFYRDHGQGASDRGWRRPRTGPRRWTAAGCRLAFDPPNYLRSGSVLADRLPATRTSQQLTDGTRTHLQAKREYTQLLRLLEQLLGQLTRARDELLAPGTDNLVKLIKGRTGSAPDLSDITTSVEEAIRALKLSQSRIQAALTEDSEASYDVQGAANMPPYLQRFLAERAGQPGFSYEVLQDEVRGWMICWKEYTHRGTVRGYGQICERPYAWLED